MVPHQDEPYAFTEPASEVAFWMALEDATLDNGCLWVVPGSHKQGDLHTAQIIIHHEIRINQINVLLVCHMTSNPRLLHADAEAENMLLGACNTKSLMQISLGFWATPFGQSAHIFAFRKDECRIYMYQPGDAFLLPCLSKRFDS